MKKNKSILILLIIAVYLVCAGGSYMFFAKKNTGSISGNSSSETPQSLTKDASGRVTFNDKDPKTEPCPLNGVMYSQAQKAWWEKHRPLGVMIENSTDARPQSGISYADVTYEAVAEGGITRTMNVYYCQDGGQVGPDRSARTYFLDFISEYGSYPLYAHVGGANTDGPANALGQIEDYGWAAYNDLNQFSIGFPTFWRDYDRLGHDVATEHTMYSTTSKLWDFAAKNRDLTNVDKKGAVWNQDFVPYTFSDTPSAGATLAKTVHIEFWEGYKDYFVDWNYDAASGLYLRKNGGVVHMDKDTNKQLSAKTVVVLSMIESHADDGYENNAHLLYKTKGTGKAMIFVNGTEIKGTWQKDSRTDRTLLFDQNGKAIQFARGKIWFEIVPTDGVVTAQ